MVNQRDHLMSMESEKEIMMEQEILENIEKQCREQTGISKIKLKLIIIFCLR